MLPDLRPYQDKALAELRASFARHDRTLLVAPCLDRVWLLDSPKRLTRGGEGVDRPGGGHRRTPTTAPGQLTKLDIEAMREAARRERAKRAIAASRACRDFSELQEVARRHGYKLGWAGYRAEEMGWRKVWLPGQRPPIYVPPSSPPPRRAA